MTGATLQQLVVHEEEIKRSRFRAIAAPCQNEDEIKAFFTEHQVPDATHNCYAWRIGQTYRFNDDGEPSGTAGRPILQAIDGQALDQVAVLVVRWYGGIKLGAGGLVRAYGGSAARCLQSGERRTLIQYTESQFHIPFDLLGIWHQLLSSHDAVVLSEEYISNGLNAKIKLPIAKYSSLVSSLRDASAGQIIPKTQSQSSTH